MKEPLISIKLHDRHSVYAGGAVFAGEFQIDAVNPEEIEAVELSVLWFTEGKGDEDLAVHHFQRFTAAELGPTLHELRQFSTVLPRSPISYEGQILKIRWSVRVRVFLNNRKQYVADHHFQLGRMPNRCQTSHPAH